MDRLAFDNVHLSVDLPQKQCGNDKGKDDNMVVDAILKALSLHVSTATTGMPTQQMHSCCKNCDMQELNVNYTWNENSKTIEVFVNHTTAHAKTAKLKNLNGLFVCPLSGHLHLCGKGRCKLPGGHGVCEDGSYVCLLTGMIVDSGEWIGKTWQQDDLEKGSGEHLSWKADKQHSKKEAQGEKLWNVQFDSLKSEVKGFRTLLFELLPGGKHSRRIHKKIMGTIIKQCKLKILNCVKRHLSINSTLNSASTRSSVNIMKIKEILMGAVRKCYIECNGLRVMCLTARQRRSIANAYTASIFNLYNAIATGKWSRIKHGKNTENCNATVPPRRTTRFVQFGFNVLMLSQSGLCFSNNQVIKEDTFLKSALPCVHHIMKDSVLLLAHPYIKYMARSTKRMVNVLKSQPVLPFMEPVDAQCSAHSCTELCFCAEGYHGNQQQFIL